MWLFWFHLKKNSHFLETEYISFSLRNSDIFDIRYYKYMIIVVSLCQFACLSIFSGFRLSSDMSIVALNDVRNRNTTCFNTKELLVQKICSHNELFVPIESIVIEVTPTWKVFPECQGVQLENRSSKCLFCHCSL